MASKSERRWSTWENAYRVAGEGSLGVHHGPCMWTLDAAERRRDSILAKGVLVRVWVETYADGAWKRVGDPVQSQETAPVRPIWWVQFYSM